jgi:hypothetical protein
MADILVNFDSDWSDEFNVDGFKIYDKDAWEELKKRFLKLENFSWYFGTNEGFDEETPKQFLENYDEKDITNEEEAVILKFFPHAKTYGWGNFPELEEILEGHEE